jgi:AcrR family transcriptional regulator
MTRKADPARREAVEAAVLQYVLEHGIADLSLRPLAEAIGLSTYALVYHFGSKDGVVAAVLGNLEEGLRAQLAAWAGEAAVSSPAALLREIWAWATDSESQAPIRLFFEVYGLALQQPERFPGLLERAGPGSWVAFLKQVHLEAGGQEDDAEVVATLIVATVMGLQLDLLTSGDLKRTTAAVEAMAIYLTRYTPNE